MRSFLLIILGALLSCVPTKSTSVLYGDNYDKNTDLTSVTILPYGQVKIPGKWTKTDYNSSSRQHFFKDTDSVTFAIGLNPWDKYEFYKPEMTPNQFIKAYYEWDSNYWQEQTKGLLRIIKENTDRNFIIWNLKKEPNIDSYFLFGLKNKTVFNLYVTTDKWDEGKIAELLEKTYNM
jgi:hypothetical protein